MTKQEHYQDTKERVLATGESLILGRGFSAIGLNEILTQAAVPKGSFYHYFASKEAFGVAILQRYFAQYHGRVADLFESSDLSPRAKLLQYFSLWKQKSANSDCQEMCLAVKLAAEVSDLSEPMRLALQEGMNGITRQLAEVLRAAQSAGELAAELNADELAANLYSVWVGASLLTKVNLHMRPLDLAYQHTEQILNPDLKTALH